MEKHLPPNQGNICSNHVYFINYYITYNWNYSTTVSASDCKSDNSGSTPDSSL